MSAKSLAGVPVKVYTKNYCAWCTATKRWLLKHEIPFHEINIDNDEEAREKIVDAGYSTMPVIIVDGHGEWSGFRYDNLQALKAELRG